MGGADGADAGFEGPNGDNSVLGTWTVNASSPTVNVDLAPASGAAQSLNNFLGAAQVNGALGNVLIEGPGIVVATGTENIPNLTIDAGANLALQGGALVTDPVTIDADGNISGYGMITGAETANGTIAAAGGTLDITGDITGTGTLTFVPGGALQLDGSVAATESLVFNAPNETLIVGASADVLSPISGFGSGDQIIVNTTAAATFSVNGSIVSVIENSVTVDTLTFATPQMAQGAIAGTSGTLTDNVLCFLPGALIATPSGETPVEKLAAGDMVVTASRQARPIAWIGTGRVLATRGRRNAATPSSCARARSPTTCRTMIFGSPRGIRFTSTTC